MLPGLACTAAGIVDTLRRTTSAEVADRVRWRPDPAVQRIVGTWPLRFRLDAATSLGFKADPDPESIVRQYLDASALPGHDTP